MLKEKEFEFNKEKPFKPKEPILSTIGSVKCKYVSKLIDKGGINTHIMVFDIIGVKGTPIKSTIFWDTQWRYQTLSVSTLKSSTHTLTFLNK
jgi:hypothetical protein